MIFLFICLNSLYILDPLVRQRTGKGFLPFCIYFIFFFANPELLISHILIQHFRLQFPNLLESSPENPCLCLYGEVGWLQGLGSYTEVSDPA